MSNSIFVFVEDDPDQVEIFVSALEAYCQKRKRIAPQMKLFTSEGAFLEEFHSHPIAADLFIFDLMLKWRAVGETVSLQKPSDYHADYAGIRCKNAVLNRFPKSRIIIWTMIETAHIKKEHFHGCRLLKDKLEFSDVFDWLVRQ